MLDWFGRKLREMQEVKRDERGFTLIELLVVVIIIGILAAIAIPVFLSQRENAQDADAQSELRNIAAAATAYYADPANNASYDNMTLENLASDYGYNAGGNSTIAAIAVATDGNSFTVSATSASTNVFNYDSDRGTVEPTATTT